jgi:hypothetical protein
MPSHIRFLVTFLVAIGAGALIWGVGGLLRWDSPLIQRGIWTYMDAKGAIGIGVGALAGAATAMIIFRDSATPTGWKKPMKGPVDLS